MITKALKVFIAVDLIVIIVCVLSGNFNWLLNTQVAFISSLIVTLGAYMGYAKNINKRVDGHVNHDDEYDELEQMDDKYDLYSPEVPNEEKEYTKEEIKEEIAKTKKSLKKNYIKNFMSGFSGMASLYRLVGYIILIIGFFYLNNNGYLHIYSYVFGFIIVPVSALVMNFGLKNNEMKEEAVE